MVCDRLFPRLQSDKRELLLNKDWLYAKHITNLFSIGEIANELDVTYATITKALRYHGIESPSQQQLREAANIRKYGVKNVGSLSSSRKKALDTMTTKFGGHVWSKSGNRQNRDKTCIVKYGDANVAKTPHSKQKVKLTNQQKYGRIHPKQLLLSDDVYDHLTDKDWLYTQHIILQKSLSKIANELGSVDMSTVMRHLHSHDIETQHYGFSQEEDDITNYINSIVPGITIIRNNRLIIEPYELDIYLPDYQLAIEYCGLFWHTETAGKGQFYHKTKWEKCKSKNIQLLTIFSDEWLTTPAIVKNKIAYMLNCAENTTYARCCKVQEICVDQKNTFLDQFHIQGSGSGSINLGLFDTSNTLVSCITFKESSSGIWYLNRYATSSVVVGGFSKLLTYFTRHYYWEQIITFADLRWSQGNLYKRTGFKVDTILKPDYYYVINNKRYHKFNFRRKYLPTKLDKFEANLSEWENCKMNGIDRIWDCGKLRFVLTKENIV